MDDFRPIHARTGPAEENRPRFRAPVGPPAADINAPPAMWAWNGHRKHDRNRRARRERLRARRLYSCTSCSFSREPVPVALPRSFARRPRVLACILAAVPASARRRKDRLKQAGSRRPSLGSRRPGDGLRLLGATSRARRGEPSPPATTRRGSVRWSRGHPSPRTPPNRRPSRIAPPWRPARPRRGRGRSR